MAMNLKNIFNKYPDKKQYNIKGARFSQQTLTLEQDYKITEILLGLDLESLQKDFTVTKISDLFGVLVKERLVEKFIAVILVDDLGFHISETLASEINNSQLEEIAKDFFSLNPSVVKLFRNFAPALATLTEFTRSKNSNSSAKPSKPTS